MIELITELQAIAQSGLTYCKDPFDRIRYQRLMELAAIASAQHSTVGYSAILELFNQETGYATPKVDVRGAVFKGDSIVLVQEKSDQLWALPGGWADVNLSPADNVLKEIREETGLMGRVDKLVGVFDKRKNNSLVADWPHAYKLFFLCGVDSWESLCADANEILAVDFFTKDRIPALSIGRVNRQQIDLCFDHYYHRSLPTYFE